MTRRPGSVVIGVDLGTTSTKAVAFDLSGAVLASHSVGYLLEEPEPGQAVQDPEAIFEAVVESVRTTARALDGRRVAALSFSAAMHSLVGLDGAGFPLTPVITWADNRSEVQAARLRESGRAADLHRRTGTPVHAMSPLTKIMWFAETSPELFGRVRSWVGIKELVLLRLCGTRVVDASTASATGLYSLVGRSWDAEALALAGIGADRLFDLVPTTTVLPGLRAEAAGSLGLPAGTPVVIGASDGPSANVGTGAMGPAVAGCSIGTSGGLRVLVDRPAADPDAGVFCYELAADRWVVGGAINSGGVVLEWAGGALAPDLGADAKDGLLELAGRVPPGSDGLIMLPYVLGERAPRWGGHATGAYVGLSRRHRREHLARATLEGVCLQLALVLGSVRAAGHEVREVRATGGFARSALWRQVLADALGMPVGFPRGHEGSSFGAALLGMVALGIVPSLDVAADLVPVERTVEPDPAAVETYARLQQDFAHLATVLAPHPLPSPHPQVDQGRIFP